MDNVIDKETAEAEFDRFCEAMRLTAKIQFKKRTLSVEDLEAFQEAQNLVIGAIESGALVITEGGDAEYTPIGGGAALKFRRPRGGDLMDQRGNPRKGFGPLASITGQPEKRFSDMDWDDLQNCMAVVALFFA